MKRRCLLALATMTVMAACSSNKPAPSDDTPNVADPAVAPVAVAPPAAEPSARAAQPAPAAKPAVTSAAKPTVAPPVTPAPTTAKPVVVPPPPPPVITPTPAPVAAPAAPRGDPQAGKPLYDAQCRKCHGVIGVPPKVIKEKFPKILPFDAEFSGKTPDDAVVTILMQGKGDDMKSFKDKLTRTEMVSVAAYVRTLGQRP